MAKKDNIKKILEQIKALEQIIDQENKGQQPRYIMLFNVYAELERLKEELRQAERQGAISLLRKHKGSKARNKKRG